MSSNPNVSASNINFGAVVESLGEGVLIFDTEDKLVLDNQIARQILGSNMVVIRQRGWQAFAMIVDRERPEHEKLDDLRAKAMRQTDPVRFHMMVANAYVPCWIAAVRQDDADPLIVISIERADWSPLTEFMGQLRKEGIPAIEDTLGHARFMIQIAKRAGEKTKIEQLSGQMNRFASLIETEMDNLQTLFRQMQRLEAIRTGHISEQIEKQRKSIALQDFVEDFMEELAEEHSKRSEDDADKDIRDRIKIDIDGDLNSLASQSHLETILKDILNNALMYSKPDSPIQIRAFATNQKQSIQINITDEGIGIRESEYDRVFQFFTRGRQPQVIAESGYGLSLALCKADMEAMGGRIWFTSEEGVGTTFSLKLPAATQEN